MVDALLTIVSLVLLLNLVIALPVIARRRGDDWLLMVLLATTTGAGIAALLSRLSGDERMIDAGLALAATAAVTAAVRAAARPATKRPAGSRAARIGDRTMAHERRDGDR